MAIIRSFYKVLIGALLFPAPVYAQSQAECRLCVPQAGEEAPRKADIPIRIEIESTLDFSRVALGSAQGGNIAIDPRTGTRHVQGGLIDLGGIGVRGTVRVTGEPRRGVRISFPSRVQLRSNTGAIAEIVDFSTDLAGPPIIGNDGQLVFSFGGRLSVNGQISGVFRGSIPISADYQ